MTTTEKSWIRQVRWPGEFWTSGIRRLERTTGVEIMALPETFGDKNEGPVVRVANINTRSVGRTELTIPFDAVPAFIEALQAAIGGPLSRMAYDQTHERHDSSGDSSPTEE